MRLSVEMQVIGGELLIGSQAIRPGVVSTVDDAMRRLAAGERVYVQMVGDLVAQVQRAVQAALQAE